MKLIVNIPAFNEEEKIAETIKRIPTSFQGIKEVKIQVVNDGSQDETAKIATEAGAHFVYSHETNRGIGKTFRTAVEHSLTNQADIMVNIDADGQFDPKDIQKLIDPILKKEADMVSADRFSEIEAHNMPKVKNLLNRFAASVVGKFMNAHINDLTCGFRAYTRETLLRLNLPGDYTYTQEVIVDALGKHLKIKWIPVHVTYFEGRKSRVVRTIFSYVKNSMKIILRAIRDVRPMKFFGIPGVFLVFVALVIFIIFAVFYLQEFKITPYKNWLLFSSMIFLVGLQFVVFAFIADMIKTNRRLLEDIHYNQKKRKYTHSHDEE